MIKLPNGTVFIERTGLKTDLRRHWRWDVYYIQCGEKRIIQYHVKTKWGAKRVARRAARALKENKGQPTSDRYIIHKPEKKND